MNQGFSRHVHPLQIQIHSSQTLRLSTPYLILFNLSVFCITANSKSSVLPVILPNLWFCPVTSSPIAVASFFNLFVTSYVSSRFSSNSSSSSSSDAVASIWYFALASFLALASPGRGTREELPPYSGPVAAPSRERVSDMSARALLRLRRSSRWRSLILAS